MALAVPLSPPKQQQQQQQQQQQHDIIEVEEEYNEKFAVVRVTKEPGLRSLFDSGSHRIRQFGSRWNYKLKRGPGWMIPKDRLADAIKWIHSPEVSTLLQDYYDNDHNLQQNTTTITPSTTTTHPTTPSTADLVPPSSSVATTSSSDNALLSPSKTSSSDNALLSPSKTSSAFKKPSPQPKPKKKKSNKKSTKTSSTAGPTPTVLVDTSTIIPTTTNLNRFRDMSTSPAFSEDWAPPLRADQGTSPSHHPFELTDTCTSPIHFPTPSPSPSPPPLPQLHFPPSPWLPPIGRRSQDSNSDCSSTSFLPIQNNKQAVVDSPSSGNGLVTNWIDKIPKPLPVEWSKLEIDEAGREGGGGRSPSSSSRRSMQDDDDNASEDSFADSRLISRYFGERSGRFVPHPPLPSKEKLVTKATYQSLPQSSTYAGKSPLSEGSNRSRYSSSSTSYDESVRNLIQRHMKNKTERVRNREEISYANSSNHYDNYDRYDNYGKFTRAHHRSKSPPHYNSNERNGDKRNRY